MDDASLVGGGEAASGLLRVLARLAGRQGAGGEDLAERAALEELGDEVGSALVLAHVEDGEDVRVVERAGEASLLLEAVEALGGVAHLARQHLDGHVAAEAGVEGAVDLAHPAGPDRAQDLVRPQPRPGRERHGLLQWIHRMMTHSRGPFNEGADSSGAVHIRQKAGGPGVAAVKRTMRFDTRERSRWRSMVDRRGQMQNSLLAVAARLSDADLLHRVVVLATREREATVELVAHLAELDARRLYLGEGFGSLFSYCTGALRLAEHAAYNRIEAARASRRFRPFSTCWPTAP